MWMGLGDRERRSQAKRTASTDTVEDFTFILNVMASQVGTLKGERYI